METNTSIETMEKERLSGIKEFGVTREEAKRRVINRENVRSAFIRQSFNADIADPHNYDLVINTKTLTIDAALGAVIGMVVDGKDKDKAAILEAIKASRP